MLEEIDIHPKSEPLLVLIVDDDATDRTFASETLRAIGWETRTAKNIADAEAQIHGLIVPKPPDIILLDMQLSQEWGPDLCQRIRDPKDELYLPACWIIGFTAHKSPDKIREMLNAGANDFLSKPTSPKDLETKMEVARYGHIRNWTYKKRMTLLENALAKNERQKTN